MPKYAVYSDTEFLFDIIAASEEDAIKSDVQATRAVLVADDRSEGKGAV